MFLTIINFLTEVEFPFDVSYYFILFSRGYHYLLLVVFRILRKQVLYHKLLPVFLD